MFGAADSSTHKISYYDQLSPEENKRQAVQRRIRRAILKALPSLSSEQAVAERGSGKVWINRLPVANVAKDGNKVDYDEEALKSVNLQAARIIELMAEESVNK